MSQPDLSMEVEAVPSVSAVVDKLRRLLEAQAAGVQLTGEISNLRLQPSGHAYFTLKDQSAQLRAVMFRGQASRLAFKPVDGMQVVVRGTVTIYAARGDMQIRVDSMRTAGLGGLQERFEALKRKLAAEGLFDTERKQALPVFPRRVGVVTSASAAALQDFLNILRRRCPRLAVSVYGCRVQGSGAAAELQQGVEYFNQIKSVDVIVVTRGGGSIEDLWEFNDESLARCIVASELPVVSAVGHEIDFTLADFVADLRAPTPSAAAELLSRADEEWAGLLRDRRDAMLRCLSQSYQQSKLKLAALAGHYVLREPGRIVENYQQRLDGLGEDMRRCLCGARDRAAERHLRVAGQWNRMDSKRLIDSKQKQLSALGHRLRLLSPQAVLERGYTMVLDSQGCLVRSKKGALAAETSQVRFADGSLTARWQT